MLAERENQIISPGFPLFHPDLSTNNLFVDDDLNVTCIIDWACASSVPKSMLLVCPGLPHSRNPPSLDFIASFTEGFVERKGFDGQPALLFENSNDLWQFARLVNLDSIQDYDRFSKLFQSLVPGQELHEKLHDLKKRDEFINSLRSYPNTPRHPRKYGMRNSTLNVTGPRDWHWHAIWRQWQI